MKKLNLIEWLSRNSHEKQSPQRFGRYAAVLMMLLTLGVGQMWATDLYVRGDMNSWGTGDKMTGTSSPWTWTGYVNGEFKVATSDWSNPNIGGNNSKLALTEGSKSGPLKSDGGDNMYINSAPSGGGIYTITVTYESSNYYIKVDPVLKERNGSVWMQVSTPKIYWDNTNASYSNVTMVVGRYTNYSGDGAGSMGDGLNKITNTNLYYSTSVNHGTGSGSMFTMCVFANGSVSSSWNSDVVSKKVANETSFTASNTANLTDNTYLFSAASGDKGAALTKTDLSGYTDLNKTQTIKVYVKNAGGSYTEKTSDWPGTIKPDRYYLSNCSTATHVNNVALTASSNVTTTAVLTSQFKLVESSTATGYTFKGWGTTSSGPTTEGATYTISSISGTNTIYAFFEENTYTVSFANDGNGTTDPSSNQTVGQLTGIDIDADPSSGYAFDTWTITSGSGTFSTDVTTADNKFYPTANSTLTASFVEDETYYDVTFGVGTSYTSLGSISAVDGDETSISSGDDLISGTSVTFTASPNTGYEVAGFYSDALCTSSLQSGNTTTYTVASLSADVTVYVKFQPITYTLTWSPSSAPTGCTYTTKPTTGTYGSTVTMVITPSTGYTVSVSAVDASSNTVTLTKSTNTYTFTQPASAVTVTVTTTEIKSTVTVNANQTSMGTLKFDATGKSWGTTASVGVSTTQSITATASSGYIFSRWVLSGGAATSSSLTSGNITLKGSGTGADGIAKAVFGIEYYYKGGANSWANPSSAKLTPHENGYYAYYQVNGSYEFKITKNASGYDPEYTTIDNSYGNITLGGGNGSNITDPSGVTHYICVLYPNTAINDLSSPIIFASTTLPDLAPETTYATTFYAGNHGAINAKGTAIAKNGNASVNIGATARTLTATPESGYSFDKWVTTGSVTVTDPYSASTTVSASAAGGTVTATYLANSGWYMHGVVDGVTDWCADSYWPHRWPIDRPYRGVSGVYYRRISSILKDGYFGIHDGSSKYSGNNSGSDYSYDGSYHDLVVNGSKCFQASTAFSDKWVVINTSSSPKKIWIQSPTTYYTVTVSNEGSDARGTVVLKEKSYGNLATNEYASGETIRVEIDTVAHYSIKSVKLGDTNVTMTHSSGTKFTGDVVMPASDKTLTVTYTPWYQVKLAASPAVAADAPTAAKTTGGATVNHNDYVISGTSVTFTKDATPNSGYTWKGWYKNSAGTGDALGTGSTYTESITAATTMYAVYTENTYSTNVVVSPAGYGSISSPTPSDGKINISHHTGTSVTASPSNNNYYRFKEWSKSDGGLTVNSTTANPATFKATSTGGTITANFTARWSIVGGDSETDEDGDDAMGNWSETTNYVLNLVTVAGKDSGYVNITLPANTTFYFKVRDLTGTGADYWYGNTGKMTYGNHTRWTMTTNTNNCRITTAGAGTYKFGWNITDKKLTVTYPTSYTVTFGKVTSNGVDKGSVTATGDDGATLTSGKYVAKGSATFTASNVTGYTFQKWSTSSTYGSGSQLSTSNPYTMTSIAANKTVYAQYLVDTYTITYNLNGGSNPGGAATSFTVENSVTLPTPTKTGYTFSGWYANSDLSTGGVQTTIAAGSTGNKEYWAKWTPNTYTVHFHRNGGTGDVVEQAFTYDVAQNLTANSYTRTGYSFAGWALTTDGDVTYADEEEVSNLTATNSATYHLYAKWTANEYTVSFDENGGTLSGDGEKTVTYETTATIASCPTAYKDAYCFDGWYTDDSDGELVIAANGAIQSGVTGWTTADGKWQKVGDQTVYAQFSTPTIVLDKSRSKGLINTMPGYDTLLIDQSFSCTPTGGYNVEYTVGYAMSHTPLETQPTIKYGTRVAGVETDTIKMPVADGINTYEVVATLRTGTTRGSGDVIRRDTIRADVETSYSVKIRARVDGVDIADEREARLYPSFAAMGVTIWDTISGYELDSIDYGVGVTPVDTTLFPGRNSSKYIRCYSDNPSTITAVYKPLANTVYFFNYDFEEYDWSYTRAKLYDYGADGYWGAGETAGKGAGSWKMTGDTIKPVDVGSEKWMTSIASASSKFAITYDRIDGHGNFCTYDSPNGTPLPPHVIYRTDFNAATPMFVPVATSNTDYYLMNTVAHYYRGFWVKNSPNIDSTGYFLKVYDKVSGNDPAPKLIQSIPLRLTQTGEGDSYELTATMDLEGNKTYGFKFTKADTGGTKWFGKNVTLSSSKQYDEGFTTGTGNCGITTTSAGDYTFHVYCANFGSKDANTASADDVQGRWGVKVDFATLANDYRLLYSDDVQTEPIASQTIRKIENAEDTVSFFVRAAASLPVLKIQKFNGSAWTDTATVDVSSITEKGIYVFYLKQSEAPITLSVTGHDAYDGDIYIRTDCVDEHKWDYKQSLDNHKMHETDYGMASVQPFKFSHYFVNWVDAGGNVKYVIATKYSPCLTDTVITDAWADQAGGNLGSKGANVRFMYNKNTNATKRDYLAGTQGETFDANYLKLSQTSTNLMRDTTSSHTLQTDITFHDAGNWIYTAEIEAKPGLEAKLSATFNSQIQFFRGSAESGVEILGGTGDTWHTIDMTYDFKTNRLICAWRPDGDSIDKDMAIDADVMIIRKAQGDAEQIVFKGDGQLSDVKYIYGVIQFDYNDMFGMMNRWDYWAYMHCMYYISFPYDVLVNDITGVGQLGVDWRLQRYNGAKRAANGWFADGEKTFWEDVQEGDTLKAFEGYSLLLNRSRFNGTKGDIWKNKDRGSSVYLYFPSAKATTGIVANDEVTVHVPEHLCTKDQTFVNSSGMTVNHKETDSHWNMIGTPLFEDKTASTISPADPINGETLRYIYTWNYFSNTLGISAILNTGFEFKTMYSYMAQFAGDITFSGSTVNKIVAAKRNEEKKNYRLNLELSKDDQFIGRTYVELRENAVDTFLLNEDICMFRNGVNADLFTYAGTYEAGANVLPIADQTVQVGVAVKTAGTYVFSMPDSFDGEVTLVDNYAQTRTNLALEDYEIALPTGEITDRFFLEIKINKVPTAIDGAGAGDGSLKDGKAHKFIMNDMMYILKDGVLYDARGNRVK